MEAKNIKMPTTDEVMVLRIRLGNELIKSALETIKKGGEISEIIFWKEDWWIGINLPDEYPEMVIEVIKHAAKQDAVENLTSIYSFSVREDEKRSDYSFERTKKLFLVKI